MTFLFMLQDLAVSLGGSGMETTPNCASFWGSWNVIVTHRTTTDLFNRALVTERRSEFGTPHVEKRLEAYRKPLFNDCCPWVMPPGISLDCISFFLYFWLCLYLCLPHSFFFCLSSLFLSFFLCASVSLSVCLSVCLFLSLTLFLSLSLSLCLCLSLSPYVFLQ